jgi:hypothetical protein
MDHANRFESKATYLLLRAEYGVALAVCVAVLIWHITEIRWIPAVVLFVYIDLIGYIPGLIAYLRSPDHRVPKAYYVLYNTMHSFVTQAAVVGIWVAVAGWEWALLFIPVHLCGDRALFGNFLKPFRVPFEPKVLPAFEQFERSLAGSAKAPAKAAEPASQHR